MTGTADDSRVRLDCGCCVLRPWREGDEPSLVPHANNREVSRRLRARFPHPYTRADAEWWVAFAKRQDPQTQFAIEVDGEAACGIGLEPGSDIERRTAEIGYWLGEGGWGGGVAAPGGGVGPGSDSERRTAEIGYWLGEAVWGRGIATAVVGTVTRYGF